MTLKFGGWPRKTKGTSFTLCQALCIISDPSVNSNWSYNPETLNSGQNLGFFVPCRSHGWIQTGVTVQKRSIRVKIGDFFCTVWPWNLMDAFEKQFNRALALYYVKLFASWQSHGWIQTWVTVRKRGIRVKISDFLSRVTLRFDGWPWKTIGCLFYAASSLVHTSVNSNWSSVRKRLN